MLDLESSSKRGVIGAGAPITHKTKASEPAFRSECGANPFMPTLKPARASTTRRAGAAPR
jgi:hypothetical protein